MRFLLRLLVSAAALWIATRIVVGVTYSGSVAGLLGVAVVFGVVNALVRPIVKLFAFPALILTLGLFTFVINAAMLWLTSALARSFGLAFGVHGVRAAFVGALVVTIASFVLSLFLPDDD